MGENAVDLLGSRPEHLAEIARNLRERLYRKYENIVALERKLGKERLRLLGHLGHGRNRKRVLAAAGTHDKVGAVAVGAEDRMGLRFKRSDARRFVIAENDRTRAVAEKNAARAVGPVKNARKRFRSDYESLLVGIEIDESAGLLKSVDKARASGLKIERARVRTAENTLYDARRGRERIIIGGRGRKNDKTDFLGLYAGRVHSGLSGFSGHSRGGFALPGNMTGMNTRMGINPFV